MQTKKTFLTIIAFLLIVNINAQSSKDIIVVDEIAGNIEQLKIQYGEQANAYFIEGIETLAPEQIANALEAHQVVNLYIYVPTKPGAIVFSSIAVTPKNVTEVAGSLKSWKDQISGKVFIHSNNVFTTGKGIKLKHELEEITGLAFSMK